MVDGDADVESGDVVGGGDESGVGEMCGEKR